MNIIEIENLNFSYKNKIIFENLNLNIKKNSFTTVLGSNGSGKSTLAKLLISKNKHIKKNADNIILITTNPDIQIIGKTVKEQLLFFLKQNNIEKNIINSKLKKIINEFNLKKVINLDPYTLNNEQKQIIIILSLVISEPQLLILDDALCFVSTYYKEKILNYLKKQKMSIINFTNDPEESIYGNNIVIINKKVILNKPIKKALKEEKIFLNNNLKLPFMAELSLKLQYYNLLDDIILKKEEMVNRLWS